MTPPLLALPVSAPIHGAVKKKRVLLIDTSHAKRDLRAEILRKLGIDVDCPADIAKARSWWRPAVYDLVLVNMDKGRDQRDKFCDDLRSATPRSGWPSWLASQNISRIRRTRTRNWRRRTVTNRPPVVGRKTRFLSIREIRLSGGASRSFASIARTRAMRALPPPPQDFEGRPAKPTATPTSLDDLLKEELR